MKKRKFFGLVTLLMSIGLAGCFGASGNSGEGGGEGGGGTGEEGEYIAKAEGHYQIINGKKTDLEPHVLVASNGDKIHVPQDPTCERDGKVYEKCSVCGKFVDKTVKALGHDLSIDLGSAAATCDSPAYVDKQCSRCDYREQKFSGEPLGHQWGTAETIKDGITKATCGRSGCDSASFTFDTAKTDAGWNGASGTGNTAYKMGSRSTEENGTWNLGAGLVPDGSYAIEIECEMTSSSHDGRYFFNHTQNNKPDPASNDSDKDGSDEAPFRYQFAINGSTTYINPTNDKTYGENNMSADEYKFVRVVDRCEISGLTSLTLHHGKIGYSLKIKSVRLVKLAAQ